MRQTVSRRISGNLIDPRPEYPGIFLLLREPAETVKQPLHTVKLQGRPEIAGKKLPVPDRSRYRRVTELPALQIFLQKRFTAHGDLFPPLRGIICRPVERDTPAVKPVLQLLHQLHTVRVWLIHFVNKEEGRNPVFLQQLPERRRMRLHAVRAADD